jgi:hypothetical protein
VVLPTDGDPVSYGVVSDEKNEEEVRKFLEYTRDAVGYSPVYLTADSNPAFHKVAKRVWPNLMVGPCVVHLKDNIRDAVQLYLGRKHQPADIEQRFEFLGRIDHFFGSETLEQAQNRMDRLIGFVFSELRGKEWALEGLRIVARHFPDFAEILRFESQNPGWKVPRSTNESESFNAFLADRLRESRGVKCEADIAPRINLIIGYYRFRPWSSAASKDRRGICPLQHAGARLDRKDELIDFTKPWKDHLLRTTPASKPPTDSLQTPV